MTRYVTLFTGSKWLLRVQILELASPANFDKEPSVKVNFIVDKNLTESNDARKNSAFSAVAMVLSGYKPGFELIAGSHPNAVERFVVLYVRGSPRLLLPPAGPVMRTAIMSFLGNRRFANLVPRFVQAASWAGGPLACVSANVSLMSQAGASSPLRELISNVLGRNDFQIALRLSFGRPNAKTVAMVISDAGEALCFAKFGSEAMTNDLVAHESAILEQFENTDMPVIMPRRLYSGTWAGGHNVLITAPLQLEPLKSDARIAHQAADAFAFRNLVTSSALRESTYWLQIIKRVGKLCDSGNGSDAILTTVARIEQAWGDCHFDFGASHGDWTRANLGIVEGRVAALDWERCTKLAPRGIDIAHFTISENSSRSFNRSLDIERVAENVRQYLNSAGLLPDDAESLVMLALLQMVIRFKSAQNVGLRSADLKFGSALQAGLQKWAV